MGGALVALAGLLAAPAAGPQDLVATEDAGGATVRSGGVDVELSREVVHDGETSVKLSAMLGGEAAQNTGGEVAIYPPEGLEWLGDRLVFWCYPVDAPLLGVIVWDADLTAFSCALAEQQLTVGQWNRVEIVFSAIKRFSGEDRQFGAISAIKIMAHQSWDQARRYYTTPGRYTWYIDDLHVEGRGPVPITHDAKVVPRQPSLREPAEEGGATWLPANANVTAETALVKEGQSSIRLSATLDRLDGEGSGGHVNVFPPPGKRWQGDRVVFWCLAEDAPVLSLQLRDRDYRGLAIRLGPETLKQGEWTRVEVPFAEAARFDQQEGEFGDVGSVTFLLHTSIDPERKYITKPGEHAWLIDGLHFEGQAPPEPAVAEGGKTLSDPEESGGAQWMAVNDLTLALDTETVHEGEVSVRMTASITDLSAKGSGGYAVVTPSPDDIWLGDRLVFWCYPQEVGFLGWIVHDMDGTGLSGHLSPDELKPGEWNRVEINLVDGGHFMGKDMEFGEVARVMLMAHSSWAHRYGYFREPGEYTWYVDDLRLEGEGPVALENPPPVIRSEESISHPEEAGGAPWTPRNAATVQVDREIVQEGEVSVRFSVTVDLDTNREGGGLDVTPPQGAKWTGDRLAFWCCPVEVPFLGAIVYFSSGSAVATVVPPEDLTLGEWNRVEIVFRDANQFLGDKGRFGDVTRILLQAHTSWDRQKQYIDLPGDYTWYIDNLRVEGQPVDGGGNGDAPPAEAMTIDDLGLDILWTATGDCSVEPAEDPLAGGGGAAKLVFRLGEDTQSGGEIVARPADGNPWPASGIRLSCLPWTVGYLVVEAEDSDGSKVIWYLYGDDLLKGKWRELALDAVNMNEFGTGDASFDNIASLSFSLYGRYDPNKAYLPRDTDVVYHLGAFALGEAGPTPLKPLQAGRGKPDLTDDSGANLSWRYHMRAYAEAETGIVKEGERSLKLSLPPRRTGQSDWGFTYASVKPPRATSGLALWLYPLQPGPFAVWAADEENNSAQWMVAADELQPGQWNEVYLPLDQAACYVPGVPRRTIEPTELGPIARLQLPLHTIAPETATETYIWYIDSVALAD